MPYVLMHAAAERDALERRTISTHTDEEDLSIDDCTTVQSED